MDYQLKKGDLLYRTKGLVEHAGVYLGNAKVLHNSPVNNVEIVDLESFANRKALKVKETVLSDLNGFDKRLNELLSDNKRYEMLGCNCENTANYLINGVSSSSQSVAGVLGGLLGAWLGSTIEQKKLPVYILGGAFIAIAINNITRNYNHVA